MRSGPSPDISQPGVAGTKTLECRGKRLHVTRIFDSARARSNAHFPLTPTLSLGERENHFRSFDEPPLSQSPNACARALPLPKGEGRGEGEPGMRTELASEASDACKVQSLAAALQ